jgi:hypothetical protein
MTAIKDAFAKAGMDTGKLDLRAAATEALDAAKGNVARAATRFSAVLKSKGELREAIALDYLQRLAAEPPQPAAAEQPQAQPSATPAAGSIKVKEHKVRQHRRRTHEEREAALRSAGHAAASMAGAYDRQIDGRPIGELRWGELQALRHNNAFNAASYLRYGNEATANFILLDKLEAHVRVTDHSSKVKDVIGEAQLQVLSDEADVEAPRLIGEGMQAWVTWLETQRDNRRAIAP